MIEVVETEAFSDWLRSLKDSRTRAIVQARINRLRLGLTGDYRFVGKGVLEMRIHYGPGLRLYYIEQHDNESRQMAVTLLTGGTKRTQSTDIEAAIALVRALKGR